MPDFDLDAALTQVNPLTGRPVYLREDGNGYEVYVNYRGFYHYIGSLSEISRTLGLFECTSPFEVRSHDMTMAEGIAHLVAKAGEFVDANQDRFWQGRKSHLVNATLYRPHA